MLSRVASSVYWLNRYIERAENVARFIDVNLNLMLEIDPAHQQWAPLVLTTGDEAAFEERYGDATKANVIRFLTFDAENGNSILSCLRIARENARSVREIISSEMWQQVNVSYLAVEEAVASGKAFEDPREFFARVKLDSHLFGGIMDATMSHNEAWHFGRLGRLLERADKTARILDVKYHMLLPRLEDVGSPLDDLQWQAVLRSTSALEMYRKERRRRITPRDVADFLILAREFPRSIRYCVTKAEDSLRAITGTPGRAFHNAAEKRLGRLRAELDYLESQDVFAVGLHEFLQRFQADLSYASEGVHESFFAARPLAVDAARRSGQ